MEISLLPADLELAYVSIRGASTRSFGLFQSRLLLRSALRFLFIKLINVYLMYFVVVFVAIEALCAINPGVKIHRKYDYQTHFEHV